MKSTIDITLLYESKIAMKLVSSLKVTQEIDSKLNPKNAPGIGKNFTRLSRNLAKVHTEDLKHIPVCSKIVQMVMLKKPDKPLEQVTL